MNTERLIDVAMGNIKADLVLKNGNIVNVFTHEIIQQDVAIVDGTIAGIGNYEGKEIIDLQGKYVVPGLIDSHVHIESAMVSPGEFAKAVVARGTTTVIADPHEIANVCGLDGIRYMLSSSEELPINIYLMMPSCVPATDFENSGAKLNVDELSKLINHPRILGLGEMMNYPGVINKDKDVMDKLKLAKMSNKIIDGHGPNLKDKELNAYVSSGVKTDHECSTVEEMIDRLKLGMYVLIREGSAARNLLDLIKGLDKVNYQRCLFCTDDRHPQDILSNGHIDNNIKLAIKNGIDPIIAIQMATINAASCYKLNNIGAIAPSYEADFLIVDNLEEFNIEKVYKNGVLVAENKKPLFEVLPIDNSQVIDTVKISEITKENLQIKINNGEANVIKLIPHSLVTKNVVRKVYTENDSFKFNSNLDIVKLVVVERHKNTNNIGLALVQNFKIKQGAIASTIAHDSHNIIAVGDNDEDIVNAINEVNKLQGGIAISSVGEILDSLELKVAGLMSEENLEYVNLKLSNMLNIAYEKLKVNSEIDPFMTLSFLALPVIPEVKLTDKGLFDVVKFEFIDI